MNWCSNLPRIKQFAGYHWLKIKKEELPFSRTKKSEFLIPTVINYLIQMQSKKVFALNSNSNWFGITHKEDIPFVGSEIQKIVDNGEYPKVLF